MKVFVFGIRGFPFVGGGAERHSEELYPRLVKKGYDITVLSRVKYFDELHGVKFKKIPYIDEPYLETMSHSILCSLYCIWKKPDLVHIHNMGACLLIPLLILRGIKVVFTIHSFNYQHKKWGRFARCILNLCESLGVNLSHRVITISKEMKDVLIKKYQRQMFIHYVSNAVNKPEYVPAGMVLKKYKLEAKKYILAVGRLVPEKGFDKLIEAHKKWNRYKLVIVGNGDTQYAKDLKKTENVIFTGFLCGRELAELYTNAGLMVLSSFHEGFPLVYLEALSYELPIVASNIHAFKHIHLPPYRYYFVDDAEELAVKMESLFGVEFTKKEKYHYKHILENEYNWDKVAQRTKEMYDTA